MKIKHMARYYQPGSFYAEDTTRELPERSIDAALAQAPEDAFAFVLFDSPICDFDFDASLFKVIPIAQNESAKHYIRGAIYTAEELRRLDADKYRTLIANIEGNRWQGAVHCRTGNWQPYESGDVLVGSGS